MANETLLQVPDRIVGQVQDEIDRKSIDVFREERIVGLPRRQPALYMLTFGTTIRLDEAKRDSISYDISVLMTEATIARHLQRVSRRILITDPVTQDIETTTERLFSDPIWELNDFRRRVWESPDLLPPEFRIFRDLLSSNIPGIAALLKGHLESPQTTVKPWPARSVLAVRGVHDVFMAFYDQATNPKYN